MCLKPYFHIIQQSHAEDICCHNRKCGLGGVGCVRGVVDCAVFGKMCDCENSGAVVLQVAAGGAGVGRGAGLEG